MKSRLASVYDSGGICVVYSSMICNSIFVVFWSLLCSSFFIVTAFPDAFASTHAIALDNKQPTWSCVLGYFFVSSQIGSSMLSFMVSMICFSCIVISASSAISIRSISSFGSVFCT